ncbi:hypothetical protein DIZ81_10235 [Legionella taurinensis]|uniref:HAD family hydrolase n=1 Tax=Legionella taurinensis TaxID=70611 RepID=A0AB38N286_9GAMM|nr:hypothetical protein [Legionella taurinensis]MDX1838293.1 hypothetical protein [Legionella taurinensis]PUT39218.1 hypothetical protein DB744_10245 [Legionella taurinensis]PUT40564.1 hypothetical protein DB746_10765 [Legionella taurinensis]PUT43984.1 hypothetical protein DB743_08965 [Legionella taurinensis]PUT46246.1 hypothetical protein DB745_11250 [Legionella taurinensis]
MTKKVAFVDIDGCILHGNRLNQALVEQLREYDEVILFTQRSVYLQMAQIPLKYQLSGVEEGDLVNTPDVVDELGKVLGKRIRVSTSIDPYYKNGKPMQYFDDVLKGFEDELKKAAGSVKQGEEFKLPAPLVEQYNEEITLVWDGVEKTDSMKKENPASFYPQGKVAQFDHLRRELFGMLETDDLEITYFDDSLHNLYEVAQETKDNKNPPQCMVVQEAYIGTLNQWQVDYPNTKSVNEQIKSELQETSLAKLCNYVVLREGERRLSHSEYNGSWARLFAWDSRAATVKISAAKKAIKILQGCDDAKNVLNDNELAALQQGRLKDRIGDDLQLVKQFCKRHNDHKVVIIH